MKGVILSLLPPKCDIFLESPWPELLLGEQYMKITKIMKIMKVMNNIINMNMVNIIYIG